MYLIYGCGDFLDTYQRFLNGRAFATVIRAGYPANPHAERKTWKHRQHEIVFAKTGVNPAALREGWKKLPARVQPILHESTELVLSGADETIAGCCATVFANRRIHWGETRELFLSVCSSVDFYVRAVRAEQMVRALMRHNALIVGDWSHLDQTGARARFIPPIPASELDELYADSRIVANILPSVRYGEHERIMAGLLSGCAVISDSTPHLDRTLERFLVFRGVATSDEIDHAISSLLTDPAIEDKLTASLALAREMFSLENFVTEVLSLLELERYRKADLNWWTFPPRG
jgi:hypothetical protein